LARRPSGDGPESARRRGAVSSADRRRGTGRSSRRGRRRARTRNAERAAPPSARAPAGLDRRPDLRDRVPLARRRGVLLHVRLADKGGVKRDLVVLAVLAAGCGSSTPAAWTVHPDGRIGPLRIDVSTDADVRKATGRPDKIEQDVWPSIRGHTLVYRCG